MNSVESQALEQLEQPGRYRAYRKLWADDGDAHRFYEEYAVARAEVESSTDADATPYTFHWRRRYDPKKRRTRSSAWPLLAALFLPFWLAMLTRAEAATYWEFATPLRVSEAERKRLRWLRPLGILLHLVALFIAIVTGVVATVALVGSLVNEISGNFRAFILGGGAALVLCLGASYLAKRAQRLGLPPFAQRLSRDGWELHKVRKQVTSNEPRS